MFDIEAQYQASWTAITYTNFLHSTSYKAALKSGYHDFTSARDSYRVSTSSAQLGMHQDCIRRYIELQAQMIAVIAPHWADYIWQEVLKKVRTLSF
jgi:leucyl-tRNA synthetase